MRRAAVVVALAALLLAPVPAAAQSAGGYGDYVDWEGWARVASLERVGLASSMDPNGGMIDYNHYEYPPGLIFGDLPATAATITGPGIVYRFWMPHRIAAEAFAVRMYFDGESSPRINTDSHQILEGLFSFFDAPLVTTFAGGQVCYEPIPFRDSLRIDTENQAGVQHYYQYSYMRFPPGTDLESWDGTLDGEAAAARSATVTMFQNLGQHPAGESATARRIVLGSTSVPAGGVLTLARPLGPGLIRRLNIRLHNPTDVQLDSLRLRAFWDADSLPAIDAPVGWFFGAGHNRAAYSSLPMGTNAAAGYYCYWPMPFRQAARLELVNPLPGAIPIDSTVVEFEPGVVDLDLGYFHAEGRHAVRTAEIDRYVLAEAQGTGHYVGNMLFLEQDVNDDWMLEGDDILIVDGTQVINGTGLEDAYNGGYYYNWVANWMPEPEGPSPPFAIRPLNGILRRQKTASPPFARADQYRWMIADHVPFTQSLVVSFESDYAVVGSRWVSVAFWYELEPLAPEEAPTGGGLDGARRLELGPVTPNPASGAIAIRFAQPLDGHVIVDLIDVAGRKVATLSEGERSAGVHEIRWERGSQPDGVYFVRLRAGGATEYAKVVLTW